MKVVTVRDFRDHATEMFRSDDVILVTREGTPAGFFLPWDTPELPVEVRREVFLRLSEQVGGFIAIPGAPGIGVELVPDVERKFPYRPRPISMRPHVDGSMVDQ